MRGLLTNKTGFTLLELCIAVIMIALLVTMAISYYGHAMENVRLSDAVSLMGVTVASQERYMLTQHHYTHAWHKLDAAPIPLRFPTAHNSFANGTENTIYYTGGKKSDGEPANGFKVYFEEIGTSWYMTADRVGSSKYSYTLVRPFNSDRNVCVPNGERANNIKICLDVMGLDDPSELPPDPRSAASLGDDDSDDEDEEYDEE